MDILREIEAAARNAWEDREADEVLDAIEAALNFKYRQRVPDLIAFEICFEDMAAFRLPYSNNDIAVIPSRVTYGLEYAPCVEHNLDAFLVTSKGVTILENAEIGEGDDE